MSSKLVSLARIVFSSKVATARAAPAAIVGPLQRIFGCTAENSTEEERHEEDHHHQQEQETEDSVVLSEETLQSSQENTAGVFSALVTRAEATVAARAASAAPIDTPSARQELRDFQQEYYRRSIAVANERSSRPDPSIADPDLSIPVGDEYLYLAQ